MSSPHRIRLAGFNLAVCKLRNLILSTSSPDLKPGAKELRQVEERRSRGTPAMQEKTRKPREPAATVCHPVSQGSKVRV